MDMQTPWNTQRPIFIEKVAGNWCNSFTESKPTWCVVQCFNDSGQMFITSCNVQKTNISKFRGLPKGSLSELHCPSDKRREKYERNLSVRAHAKWEAMANSHRKTARSTMMCLHQGAGKEATDDMYALRTREEREVRMRLELFVNTSWYSSAAQPPPISREPRVRLW